MPPAQGPPDQAGRSSRATAAADPTPRPPAAPRASPPQNPPSRRPQPPHLSLPTPSPRGETRRHHPPPAARYFSGLHWAGFPRVPSSRFPTRDSRASRPRSPRQYRSEKAGATAGECPCAPHARASHIGRASSAERAENPPSRHSHAMRSIPSPKRLFGRRFYSRFKSCAFRSGVSWSVCDIHCRAATGSLRSQFCARLSIWFVR